MNQTALQPGEVKRALEKWRDVSGVSYIGETKTQKCARDGVPLWRFTGLKNGWQHMAHVCPVCRRVKMWNLDIPERAEHFEI